MSWKHLHGELLQRWKPDFVLQKDIEKLFSSGRTCLEFILKMNVDSESESLLP